MNTVDKRVPTITFSAIIGMGVLYLIFDLHPMFFFTVESVLLFVFIHYILKEVE